MDGNQGVRMERLADLDRVLELLQDLVYDGTPVVFTGKSLQVIFKHLHTQLGMVKVNDEAALLEWWAERIAPFRNELRQRATLVQLSNSAETFLLITENVAMEATAMDVCPPPPEF